MKPIQISDIVKAAGGILLCGDDKKMVTSVCINSREITEGALFVPLIGEKVDAHRFIEMAFEKGAAAVFTSEHKTCEDSMKERAFIQVEDTKKALQDFATYYRSQFSLPVIGVTGSVGKTTTKEMIAAALETKYKVLKTEGNKNSQIGLSLMMFEIEEDTQIAVIEMGMSEEGEMKRLAEIARPETAVMTNIGVSHIGQLGSKENIRREKLAIINACKEGGMLYLNADDELLEQVGKEEISMSPQSEEALKHMQCVYYGISEKADVRAEKIKTRGEETFFDFVYQGKKEPVILSVPGMHNVRNALTALAVAMQYGIEAGAAKEGLKIYKPIAMRGQIYENNGIKIIDDTYNASPDSMKSGIDVLLTLTDRKRRITVFGDVLELGSVSYECHYEVGVYLSSKETERNKIDYLVTVGEEAKTIAKAVKERSRSIVAESFDDNAEAVSYLKKILCPGDGILIKGSRGMHMEDIVNALIE